MANFVPLPVAYPSVNGCLQVIRDFERTLKLLFWEEGEKYCAKKCASK